MPAIQLEFSTSLNLCELDSLLQQMVKDGQIVKDTIVEERSSKKLKREIEQKGEYIGGGGGAKVYKAVGKEYVTLLLLVMAQLFSGTLILGPEPLDIFVVEEFDPKYKGKEPNCPSLAEIEKFYTLKGPCAIFATKAALEAMQDDFGAPGQETIAITGDYVWLYGLAPDVKLPPGQSTTFGRALEAVNKQSGPVKSKGRSRAHISKDKLYATDFPKLRDAGGSFTPAAVEGPIGAAPPPQMSSVLLRHSRSDNSRGTGQANGPFTANGEFKFQLLACSLAILTRFLPYVRAIFGPALHNQAFSKQSCLATTLGGIFLDAMAMTVGGWGNQPHLDPHDATNMAIIGQIAVGDTADVQGGYFVLPGVGIKIAPGECTLQAVRTTMLQHFTCPHTASAKGRYVGFSLHNSKMYEHGINSKDASKPQDDFNVVRYAIEENITEDTMNNYPAMRKLLEIKLNKKGSV